MQKTFTHPIVRLCQNYISLFPSISTLIWLTHIFLKLFVVVYHAYSSSLTPAFRYLIFQQFLLLNQHVSDSCLFRSLLDVLTDRCKDFCLFYLVLIARNSYLPRLLFENCQLDLATTCNAFVILLYFTTFLAMGEFLQVTSPIGTDGNVVLHTQHAITRWLIADTFFNGPIFVVLQDRWCKASFNLIIPSTDKRIF